MRKIYLLFLLVLTNVALLQAQTYTLKIWSGKIPGSKIDTSYKEQNIIDNSRCRILKVTDPEIYVFLPEKQKATGTAVVICPGGGYGRLAIDHEGYDVAKWFNEMGIAGIVLKYRLPSDKIMEDKTIGPLQDVQEAIRIVRRNAAKWNIAPDKIGVMGFSAGGHLAGTASTMYNEKVYPVFDSTSARPDFSILMYGVLSMQKEITHGGSRIGLLGNDASQELIDKFSNERNVNGQTPTAFLVASSDDGAVPVINSILYYQALVKNKIPAEIHIFEKGGHGYGLAPDRKGTENGWPEICKKWLKVHGLL
jgi:acetyl esterase/lipase